MTFRGDTVRRGNWGGDGLNTTELIKHWTMEGAAPDVGGRFRSVAGPLDMAEGDSESPTSADAPRMRRSDEEEWRPLLTATRDR